jgi:hypothetical protein
LIWPIIFLKAKNKRQPLVLSIIILVPIFKLLSQNGIIRNASDLSLFTRADAIAMGCLFAMNQKCISGFVLKRINALLVKLLVLFALATLSHCLLNGV